MEFYILKVYIKAMIQVKNVSDVITNSSSEVFCYIENDDEQKLQEMKEALIRVFGWRQESELDALAYTGTCHRKKHLVVEIPYHHSQAKAFYRGGLKEFIKNWEGSKIDFTGWATQD